MKNKRNLALIILLIALAVTALACDRPAPSPAPSPPIAGTNVIARNESTPNEHLSKAQATHALPAAPAALDEDGSYTGKEDVALYLHLYGRLPENFITKQEARELGWPGGDLRPYAKGKTIGGDRFGNYEGLLPGKKGRVYYECDIDTLGKGSRGPKRIVYSNDGLIYYTADHYESFTLLYGEGKDAGN